MAAEPAQPGGQVDTHSQGSNIRPPEHQVQSRREMGRGEMLQGISSELIKVRLLPCGRIGASNRNKSQSKKKKKKNKDKTKQPKKSNCRSRCDSVG